MKASVIGLCRLRLEHPRDAPGGGPAPAGWLLPPRRRRMRRQGQSATLLWSAGGGARGWIGRPRPCARKRRRPVASPGGASSAKAVFLTDDGARRIGAKMFKHSGEGLAEMAACPMAISGVAEPRPPGADAARPRTREIQINHRNAPPTGAERSTRCIDRAS